LSKAFGSPRFKYPALAVLILAGVFLVYYLPATHRNQALLIDRSFRILASIADQVRSRVDIYSSIIGQTGKIKEPKDRVAYLPEQVPDLEYVDCPATPRAAKDPVPEYTSVARSSKPERFDLLIHYHPDPALGAKQADSCAAAQFDRLMSPLVPAGVFDELILADEDGTVLFATARSGMRVTNIASLFAEPNAGAAAAGSVQDATAPRKPARAGAPPALAPPERNTAFLAAAKASNIWPVQLAGETYQAFLVPVGLRTRSDAVTTDGSGARFVLCGLMTQRRYQTAISGVSGPAIIAISLLTLVVVIGFGPVLKFEQMRATETIRRRTGLHYAWMMACAMTFLMMLVIHTSSLFSDAETDPRLQQLSKAVEGHLQTEVERAVAMLSAVERHTEFKTAPALRASPDARCGAGRKPNAPEEPYSWHGKTLATHLPLTEYPYFDHLAWMDGAGNQEIKWSIHNNPTPDKNVCAYDFFQEPFHQRLWRFASAQGGGPRFRVDPVLSPNTGRYVGVISQAVRYPEPNHAALSVASVVTPLMSLVDAILPPEYGFAIVDPSGQVLFHSQGEKNGSENLFHASQDDATLMTLVSSRKTDFATFYYLGVEHRAFVTPMSAMEDCPWTLVTFRDLTLRQAQIVERMTLFGILSIWYLAVMGAIALATPLRSYPPRVFWPTRARVGRYRHMSLVLALIVYAYYRLTFLLSGPAILLAAVAVPAGSIALVILFLRTRDRSILVAILMVWAALVVHYAMEGGGIAPWQKLVWASVMCGAALSLCFRSLTSGLCGRWIRPVAGAGEMWRRFAGATARIAGVWDVSLSYSLVALGLLILGGALPCIGFFRIAYNYGQYEFTRRAAMSTAAAVEQRACRVSAQYDSVRFSSPAAADPELERTARWLFLRRRLERENLDRYDGVFLGSKSGLIRAPKLPGGGSPEAASVRDSATWLSAMLDGIAARLPIWYVPREPSSGGSSGCLSASWTPQREGLNRLRLRLDTAGGEVVSPELVGLKQYLARDALHISQDLQANLDYLPRAPFLVAAALIGIAAFVLLRATIRRLFLTDFKADKPWQEIQLTPDLKIDQNLILIGLPFSGKTLAFKDRLDLHRIDLAAVLRGDQVSGRPVAEPVVVLDHFAYGCNDAESNRRKLELVERFVFKEGRTVVILTTIDPLFYVEAGTGVGARPSLDALAPGEVMDRWTKALIKFTTMRVVGGAPVEPSPSYYRVLWSTCTKRERMALYQLANEGWANCQNLAALKHLVRRGLIESRPEFRIADEDFRGFILEWVSSEDQREWQREDEISVWDGLKAALYVSVGLSVAAIALLYGQQAMGYVVAGVSAITPVIKTISDLRGKGKAPAGEP
jgi:hypothetical protein